MRVLKGFKLSNLGSTCGTW